MSDPRTNAAALAEHLDFARRLARSLIEDADSRDDVVQEACIAALSEPPDDPRRMRGWLATVVRRLSGRNRRSTARRFEREQRAARTASSPAGDDELAAMEVHKRVVDALMSLPEAYRRPLLARYFDDLSVREIAERTGEPVETIRTRLKRGLGRIRTQLEANDGGEHWLPALAAFARPVPPAGPHWSWRLVQGVAAAAVIFVLGIALFFAGGGRQVLMAYDDEPGPSSYPSEPSVEPASFPVALVGPPPSNAAATVEDRLASALGFPLEEVEELAPPLRAERARVAEATAVDVEELDAVRLFLARSGGAAVKLALVPIDEAEQALIAMTDAHDLLGVAVVDPEIERVARWDHFLRVFRFAQVPRLDGARPRSWLAERRRQALAEPDDEEARLVVALLDLQRLMNEQASVFNVPEEGRTRTTLEEFEMMAEQYAQVAELVPDLRSAIGDSADEVQTLARDSADGLKAMKAALLADDLAEVGRVRRRVMGNCKTCHFLTGDAYAGSLSDASRAKRTELGIGNGFFQIGHDVRIGAHDREAAQRVADALRVGALMIDAS